MTKKDTTNHHLKKWFVYIARCSDNSLYTGITNDLESRIKKHNSGLGAKYTRSRLPISLVLTEEYETESEARKREIQIKSWKKKDKEDLVCSKSKGK